MRFFLHLFCIFFLFMYASVASSRASYETHMNTSTSLPTDAVPKDLQGVTITENLGKKINLNLTFTDQDGNILTFGDLLKDGKPLILSLNYYRCKTLCGIQLQNLAKTLREMRWPIGKDFTVATVSFDKTDTPVLAKEKQSEYLNLLQQPNGKWNFLVGSQENIDELTKSVGFFYNYIPERNEFAHTAAIFFISPDGMISRYLYGIDYKVKDVKFALMDAAKEKIGSTIDKVLLFCCNYDPSLGRYTGLAVGIMRTGGIISILFILLLVFYYSRRRISS